MKSRRKNFGNLPRGIDPTRQRRAEDAQFTEEILGAGLKRDGKGRIVLDTAYIQALIESPESAPEDDDIGLTELEDVQLSETKDGHIMAYEGTAGVWTNRAQTASPGADHGALTGLTDDDHVGYLLGDGTRGLTGDWDNTLQRIRNTGVAEVLGTAPPNPVTGMVWLDTATTGTTSSTVSGAIKTSDYTTTISDYIIECNFATLQTITFHDPATALWQRLKIKNVGAASALLDGDGALLEGAATQTLTGRNSYEFYSNGTAWQLG